MAYWPSILLWQYEMCVGAVMLMAMMKLGVSMVA
jgi:hypothetical protein